MLDPDDGEKRQSLGQPDGCSFCRYYCENSSHLFWWNAGTPLPTDKDFCFLLWVHMQRDFSIQHHAIFLSKRWKKWWKKIQIMKKCWINSTWKSCVYGYYYSMFLFKWWKNIEWIFSWLAEKSLIIWSTIITLTAVSFLFTCKFIKKKCSSRYSVKKV